MATGGEDDSEGGHWRIEDAGFDATTGRLTVAGRAVELDRPCRALLAALLAADGRALGRDALLAAGWPGRIVHENSLTKAIGRLRQALGAEGARIEAVYGSGYRLKGPAERGGVTMAGGAGSRWRQALVGDRRRTATTLAFAGLAICVALAVAALFAAQAARARAAEEAREKEALVAFLSSDLFAPGELAAQGRDGPSLRAAVARAAATMNTELRDDPATRVTVHRMIASAYAGWGDYEAAVLHLHRARAVAERLHGASAAKTTPIDIALCSNLRRAGDTRLAETTCARAVRGAQGSDARTVAVAQLAEAKLLVDIGDYRRGAALLDAAAAQGARLTPGERADLQWFAGRAQAKLGHFARADAAFRRNLALREAMGGERPSLTGWAHADYGSYLASIGDFAAAERHFARAEARFAAARGVDAVDALAPDYGRALAALDSGDPQGARDRLRPILQRYRAALGGDHLRTLDAMTLLALAEAQAGDAARATALLKEARQTGARVLYRRDGRAVCFHMRRARTLAALGDTAGADAEAGRAAAAMDRSGVPASHPWRARLHCVAARIALARGDAGAGRDEAKRCLSALQRVADLPATYPALAEARLLAGE
ncbi:winged helix-turn-helix domain-containing protein [Sphingopyxis indica]|uniref:winged helix-turn-helix domain-containing protein n=1 Tax=Sphingopyxis indica TaxID=436663 RepID=UPI002938F65E|nr:winged helix-turn-helix domain-containing protein [Sphingopyxis indica]WOF44172.1 winged helix-turn-helix domain-containing protein [Sphingopyxis indica]